MRILILSKALIGGTYQRKLEELAALPGVDLTVAVPPCWREPEVGVLPLERRFTEGYRMEVLPIRFNGHHHIHYYPTIGRLVAELRPDVFHIDEESFNFATYMAMRAGVRYGARCCFYNYANIDRYYPPPFSLFERYAFRHAAHALVCNQDAAAIIRRHGYRGPISVLPQVGVDPALFAPTDHRPPTTDHRPPTTEDRGLKIEDSSHTATESRSSILHPPSSILHPPSSKERFVVGYIGRLVPQKGVLDLVEALPALPPSIQLRLIGDGVLRPQIVARAAELGMSQRLELRPAITTTAVPDALAQLDALVLPSRTTPNWKEQFGRVLPEAMSCAVPVVGSSSGEIPHVIGDAGLVYPEGDLAALAGTLRRLAESPELRADLGRRGRARVLAHYTQAALARRYYDIYRDMLEDRG